MSMAGWSGFSEEDLHRLKKDHFKSDELDQGLDGKPTENIRKANINTGPKRQKPREKIKTKTTAAKKAENARPERTIEKTTCEAATETSETETSDVHVSSLPDVERNPTQDEKSIEKIVRAENGVNVKEEKVPEIIVEPERIQAIELTALQKMQQKQKEIEDQNKKKKAALQETIRTRFRKTQAEANTLKYVHKELAHLDNLLSADVAVLRDTIEDATRDYHHAIKRYEHAEAEFVASKMDLHRKTERKEMLTEHLLAIIQQNEERKARKLEELMAKLDVSEEVIEDNFIKHNSIVSNNTREQYENSEKKMGEEKIEIEEKKKISGKIIEEETMEVGEKNITEDKEKEVSKVTEKEETGKNENEIKEVGQNEKVVHDSSEVVSKNGTTD